MVVGTSQSSVGGVTHLLLFLSKTSIAGHLWRRGYPPWQAQYLLQDLPRGTLPLASSLHRAGKGMLFSTVLNASKSYDASDTRPRSVASHRRVSPRCRAALRYRTVLWLSRSSRSSSGCRRSRARIFRRASHSALYSGVGLGEQDISKHSQEKYVEIKNKNLNMFFTFLPQVKLSSKLYNKYKNSCNLSNK